MVTGGIAPNRAGQAYPGAAKLTNAWEVRAHRDVTSAVHSAAPDAKICLQILHTGRYAYHPWLLGPGPEKAPIGWYAPKPMSEGDVRATIDAYGRCAARAREAGYDGVEVMGSEGYLLNQFIAARTNRRADGWGGAYGNRARFAVEAVRAARRAAGEDFVILYRLSMLDLVPGGSDWREVVELAHEIEAAGASVINTGIGWHEARVPTIATCVPRGGFSWVTRKMMGEGLGIPLCTTNRINMPQTAEDILANKHADLISMARPLLADPEWANKAAQNNEHTINTCIGCNQACLDHTFQAKRASCLVNPRACYETELNPAPVASSKVEKIAVVGAGPAGLAFSTTAAERGHNVTLFDADTKIGGQFNMAKVIPGKEEFYETLRYFKHRLQSTGVNVQLNTNVTEELLLQQGFDRVILATGVRPRVLDPKHFDHPKVLSYVEVLKGEKQVGGRVAVIGAGGIGFDVAEFLAHPPHRAAPAAAEGAGAGGAPPQQPVADFLREWGVDGANEQRGGLLAEGPAAPAPAREVWLLQRKASKPGAGLGKTTGWIHRESLKKRGVRMLAGVKYLRVDGGGLHVELGGETQVLAVDHVVVCAGQEPRLELEAGLRGRGVKVHRIGGAERAAELDAKRAIDQGTRLAAAVEDAPAGAAPPVAPMSLAHRLYQMVQAMRGY